MDSKFFLPASMGRHLMRVTVDAAAKGLLNTAIVEHLLSCDQCCQAIETQKVIIEDQRVHSDLGHFAGAFKLLPDARHRKA
jgi:hypothetical protein